MLLRVGVLILGSLYWEDGDDNHRKAWRTERLKMDAACPVHLPIRYGRESGKRRNTHTIVLSKRCYRHQELGVAYAAACSHPVNDAEDLLAEAEQLAGVEGLNDWTWSAVGLLPNPASSVPEEIMASWKRYANPKLAQCDLFTCRPKSEPPIISREGILRLRWPVLVSNGSPVEIDLLLATPTALRAPAPYPRPKLIGETFARQDYATYFVSNVSNGIRTTQDGAIWKSALRLKPEWAAQYQAVTDSLGASA